MQLRRQNDLTPFDMISDENSGYFMDQILSNFIPYSNPYVIIAWKVPEAFDLPSPQEIRCEVLWDGNVSINYPVELNGQQKPRVVADTTFTIKGWVFKEVTGPYDNIYYVDYISTTQFDLYYSLDGRKWEVLKDFNFL
jgi:hypothetical protein